MTTPFGIGLSTTGVGSPLVTTVDSPVGNSVLVVIGGNWTTSGPYAATDSAGNTYESVSLLTGAAENFVVLYSTTTLHLPAGSEITVTGLSGAVFAQAISVDTTVAPDFAQAALDGRTSIPSMTTSPLAAPGELVIGMLILFPGGGVADNSLFSPTGWLNIMAGGGHSLAYSGTGSAKALVDCKINPTTAAVTYSPTMVFDPIGSGSFIGIATFMVGAPPPPPARRRGKRARFI